MKVSAAEEYGLRIMVALARSWRAGADHLTIRELSDREGLGPEYTAKLLRVLRMRGLVDARRGATGGYALGREPSAITIWDVVSGLDSPLYGESFCAEHAGQLPACAHGSGCSVRVVWRWVGVAVEGALKRVTLADLALADDGVVARQMGTVGSP